MENTASKMEPGFQNQKKTKKKINEKKVKIYF